MTHRRTWQKAEERVARWFGLHRNRCSGSSGRKDESRGDTTPHPTLYIETKYAKRFALVTLWDDTNLKAEAESKIPVVALVAKGRSDGWLLVHIDHLQAVAKEVQDVD